VHQREAIDKLTERHQLCQEEANLLRQDVLGFKRQLHAIAQAALEVVPLEQLEGTFAGGLILALLKENKINLPEGASDAAKRT
jgi:hypothetical protein